MKIRINESHRHFLRSLAHQTVRCPDEEAADKVAYDAAAPLVKKVVEERYPRRDMNVLLKYEQAHYSSEIRLQLTAGGIVEFEFRGDKSGPLQAGEQGGYRCRNRIFALDETATQAVQASDAAVVALRDALKTKLADYQALIANAKSLEEIESVWPEAGALRNRLNRALPTILSAETLDRIRADQANRLPVPEPEQAAA